VCTCSSTVAVTVCTARCVSSSSVVVRRRTCRLRIYLHHISCYLSFHSVRGSSDKPLHTPSALVLLHLAGTTR
jgi:hypothetical protein